MTETASSPWIPTEIAGRTFQRLDLDHPEVDGRVIDEIRSGVPVYYDRRWPLTHLFCRFLLERPGRLGGKRVLVAGAGVGMEAVVAGALAETVVINDAAPVALELCAEQLEGNGIDAYEIEPGPFQEADLDGVDLVLACWVVYDAGTRRAMATLLERARERGIPALLANADIGGHFSRLLAGTGAPVEKVEGPWGERGEVVWVGRPAAEDPGPGGGSPGGGP